MESFHPTPVVPSNAPLWSDVDQDSRILREQCANRQLGYIQTHHNPDWSTGINDDTACGSAVARMPSYLPQFHRTNSSDLNWLGLSNNKYDRNAYRLFNNLNRQRHPGTEKTELGNQAKDREAEYNARVLAARFARCDGYIKYRNRQPKEKKGNKEDQKWPDHIEDAFIVGEFEVEKKDHRTSNVLCQQLFADIHLVVVSNQKLLVRRTTKMLSRWDETSLLQTTFSEIQAKSGLENRSQAIFRCSNHSYRTKRSVSL